MLSDEVLVYAGAGSSHSWTWLADLFESNGILSARFMDSEGFVSQVRRRPRIVIISGGDGFGIGSALSGDGFSGLKKYIAAGGVYVGVCAGAYLPLPSSLEPFSEFNICSTKIENIDCRLKPNDGLPQRVAVRYGSCAIVHPVRGEMELESGQSTLRAPIYGGPIFREPQSDSVLMRYRDFTPNTEFQLGERFARPLMLGRPAAIKCFIGDGSLLLFGPHLEHPSYPEANSLFLRLLGLDRKMPSQLLLSAPNSGLHSSIADLKVAIVGLENRSFVVGKKLWDGGRYLELVVAIEKRAPWIGQEMAEEISERLELVRGSVIRMDIGEETDADRTTKMLVECARMCVDSHFRRLAESR